MASPSPSPFGRPNPNGPKELADFGFAIGDWTYITTLTTSIDEEPNWNQPVLPSGTWRFRYGLDGWVVQDEFDQPLGNGTSARMVSIRAFDQEAGFWRVRGTGPSYPGWDEFEVRRLEGQVVMIGVSARTASTSGGNLVERITFHDFKPDSWKRTGEQSADGGNTWSGDVVHSLATRVSNDAR